MFPTKQVKLKINKIMAKEINKEEYELLKTTYYGLIWAEMNLEGNLGTFSDIAVGSIPTLRGMIDKVLEEYQKKH